MPAVLVVAVASACGHAADPPTGSSPTASPATPGSASPPPPDLRSVRGYQQVAPPVRIVIPGIGVDSGLEQLTRQPDGTVGVPTSWQTAGWYAAGPRPGEPGPAVILGHVDSRSGPAVFYRLRQLRPGQVVLVRRADRTVATFAVDSVARYPKDAFPTDEVYLTTLVPELRLVTCGGAFDRRSGHYVDNVIVFASLVE